MATHKRKPISSLKRRTKPKTQEESGGSYFSREHKDVSTFHTGAALLDCVLGGGWPERRMINIIGDSASGKTLLAIEACANFVSKYDDAEIYYLEAEAAFDQGYAAALGMPVDKVNFLEDIYTVEEMDAHLNELIKKKPTKPILYVIDSMDALSDATELEQDLEKRDFNRKPAQLSRMFRKLVKKLSDSNITLMIVSQVRENIGVSFGEKYKRSGGKALDFYASICLWLAHTGQLKKTRKGVERVVGASIKCNCKKNKVGMPFRKCDLTITFGYGIDDATANIEFLSSTNAIPESLGSAKSLKTRINTMDTEEFNKTRRKLDKQVRKVWYELENDFLPKHSKQR